MFKSVSISKIDKQKGFEITHIVLRIPLLPEAFQNFRFVFLSDIHLGPCTSKALLQNVFTATQDLAPDAVLLGGDYVQYSGSGLLHTLATKVSPQLFHWTDYRRNVRSLVFELKTLLQLLTPRDGIFGVFGNHDYHEGLGTIRRILSDSVSWLKNTTHEIHRNDSVLKLVGLDDFRFGRPDFNMALPKSNSFHKISSSSVCTILFAHNPDITLCKDASCIKDIDLVLTGHTHGGQICLPFGHPVITRTRQCKYIRGLHECFGSPLYVSRGIGCGGLPVRIFCPPEIVSVTLMQ